MMKLAAFLLWAHLALAQSPLPGAPTVAAPFLPDSWMGAGAAWNQYSKPQVAGWASYAKLLSKPGMIYSFTSWDITSSKSRPYTAQSSTRSGLAVLVRQFGPVSILGLGDAGMAAPPGNLLGAFSGGGIVVFKLGSWNLTLELAARVLKIGGQPNQQIYEVGFGRLSEN